MWVINEEFEKLKEQYQILKKLYDDETLTVAQHNEIAQQLYLIESKMIDMFTEFYETEWPELMKNAAEHLREKYPTVKSFLADIYDKQEWYILFEQLVKTKLPKIVDDEEDDNDDIEE
ncbi:hypothetical protein SAMN04244560_01920 [Thermoanaerobacter thermohydrosulfuricus]|uniref:Uncharacterized protein n=1 Tax=Thermoanaerobacter thermohydrosulfuricus TaxID=1516 RepID=A0A1G7S691_THETY|nr:hypothetical protein [Thermoanaerobacter thermohydrosulfuricus]SDG18518.1 hypothetical protein SAMN04244560_01920 [Thermoanaerobacter thermohydrosulfuricus]